uniref:DNA topoisomerase (ATP-hydrolyzing) n=1 Tax=Arundo donax TaxID=35708 RepID=A0A0A9D501_ARUDO
MAIGTLTREKIQELNAEKAKLENDVEELRKTTPELLWLRDLDALEKELDLLDQMDEEAAVKRKETREKKAAKGVASKAPRRKQTKKAAADSQKVENATSDTAGNAVEPVVAKRGAQRKKQAKKDTVPVSDDEEEYVPALKDRLAAFSLNDPSPDHSAMETETTEEQQNENKGRKGPSKRGAAKKASSSLAVIASDDEDEDDDFAMEEVSEVQPQKKGRGKKPTAAEKPKATTTRKRVPAQSKGMRQKKIEEMLKPTEDSNTSAPSPEKKVRKMRDSPFNKKSGSILQRGAVAASTSSENSAEASPPSGSSAEPVAAPQPRRTARATKKTVVYVSESDDSEDEVVELTDDSEFDVDGASDDD